MNLMRAPYNEQSRTLTVENDMNAVQALMYPGNDVSLDRRTKMLQAGNTNKGLHLRLGRGHVESV